MTRLASALAAVFVLGVIIGEATRAGNWRRLGTALLLAGLASLVVYWEGRERASRQVRSTRDLDYERRHRT